MICRKCGQAIPDHSRFCPFCGEKCSESFENIEMAKRNPKEKNNVKTSKKDRVLLIALVSVTILLAVGVLSIFLWKDSGVSDTSVDESTEEQEYDFQTLEKEEQPDSFGDSVVEKELETEGAESAEELEPEGAEPAEELEPEDAEPVEVPEDKVELAPPSEESAESQIRVLANLLGQSRETVEMHLGECISQETLTGWGCDYGDQALFERDGRLIVNYNSGFVSSVSWEYEAKQESENSLSTFYARMAEASAWVYGTIYKYWQDGERELYQWTEQEIPETVNLQKWNDNGTVMIQLEMAGGY